MNRATSYEELDEVRAPAGIGKVGVEAGDRGVVVETFERPRPAILVEYADEKGRTKALVFYSPDLDQLFEVVSECRP